MDLVMRNARDLGRMRLRRTHTYVTVVGGMSGLNYMLELDSTPDRVVFFDLNAHAVQYSKMIVELVCMCDTPQEFVSRIFNRHISTFLEEFKQKDLNVSNQMDYLGQDVDPVLLVDTIEQLSAGSQEIFRTFLFPFLQSKTGQVDNGAANCGRLLPCWSYDTHVPVTQGKTSRISKGDGGSRVLNTNTFYYGEGWLRSTSRYDHVKRILQNATVTYAPCNILDDNMNDTLELDFSQRIILHISNIDDFFKTKWSQQTRALTRASRQARGSIVIISSHDGVYRLRR